MSAGIIFFCFFYNRRWSSIPRRRPDNLKRYGGFHPRASAPGKADRGLLRLSRHPHHRTGAAYLVLICLIPGISLQPGGVPFYLGGTSLLIVVNVTMDTVAQIQSHLIAHQYGDLIKKAKLKTGKRR
jgi:preprotein translocase subunit SecY